MIKKVIIIAISVFIILSINSFVSAEDILGKEIINIEEKQSYSEGFSKNNEDKIYVQSEDDTIYTSGNYQYKIKKDYRITSIDVDRYIIDEKTEDIAIITKYTGTEETVAIPTKLGEKRVGEIAEAAFYKNTSIKKLVIPNDTVAYIGEGAFADCTNLSEVSLGNSVRNISYYAFQNTAITSIKLPEFLYAIRNTTFFNCSKLTNITIDSKNVHFKVVNSVIYEIKNSKGDMSLILYPYAKKDKTFNIENGVTAIEYEAVLNDYVETINIPATVTEISSQYTFKAKSLKNLNVNSSNKTYASIDGVLFSKDKKTLCIYPAGRTETTYSIPKGTTKIGQDAFFDIQSLKTINIPNTVNELELEAFGYAKSLETLEIPSSVTKIEMQTFRECTNLKKVIINANAEELPRLMFRQCENLEEVQVNGNVKKIREGAFYYCFKLSKVTLPDSLEEIEAGAFWSCRDLKNIIIPKNVVFMEKCAFYEYQNYSKGYWADTVFDISQTELVEQSNGDYVAVYECSSTGTRDYTKAYEVLKLVNQQRKNAGLNELTMDKDLLENAMLRAAEIVIDFSHDRPSGLDCFSAITKTSYSSAAENIAAYQTTPTQVMNSWMNSEGHKKNILTEGFTCIGIGCFKAQDGKYYWTQMFTNGTPTTLSQPKNTQVTESVKILSTRLPFKDVPLDTWYTSAVKYALKNKYIYGYTATTFAPFDKLSRGQLVTILWRIEGEPDTSKLTNKFTDVDEGVYYTEPIKWANSVGIVKGYGGTTKFGPGDPIIRQDLCIVLNRYAAYKKKSATGTSSLSKFTDYKTVSNYAENAVKWAVENSIVSGNALPDGTKTIAPMANATRCEVALMLMRYCEKFN